jgi:hypothetical protein
MKMSRTIFIKTLITLVITITAITAFWAFTPASAFAEDPLPEPKLTICFVDRLKASLASKKDKFIRKVKKTPPSREELNRLSKIKVSDIFPDTENVLLPGDKEEFRKRTVVSAEQIEAFKKDWDELVHQRVSLMAYNDKELKKAIEAAGGQDGYPSFSQAHVDNYKSLDLTLSDLQDYVVIDHYAQQTSLHRGYDGWGQYFEPKSPYFLAKLGTRAVKSVLSNLGSSVKGGIYFAVAASLYKPLTDAYNRKFNAVSSKAIDKLHKDLNDAIAVNKALEKEALGIDFAQMATNEARVNKWYELEGKFKKSHETIRKNQMEIPSIKTQIEQSRKAVAPWVQGSRIALLTSFNKFLQTKDPDAISIMALSLANFKAMELKIPPSDVEAALTKDTIDQVLRQVADNPVAFQQFIHEFVQTQKE